MSLKSLNAKIAAKKAESAGSDTSDAFSQAAATKLHGEGRARATHDPAASAAGRVSSYVHKIEKKAAQLADLMTEEDLEDDVQVIRDAKKATRRIWDVISKTMIEEPDHKTRLAATQFSRAYAEGLPIQRQVQLRADLEGLDETLARLRATPEVLKEIGGRVIDASEGQESDKK